MSVSLELLTEILAKVGISSSQEEEILTAIKDATTPLEAKEEVTSEEFYTVDNEQACEKEVKENEERLSSKLNEEEHYAYKSCIEQWFQVGTCFDKFRFYFYEVSFPLQQLDSFIFVNFYSSFEKLPMNIFLLLLRTWLHWTFDFSMLHWTFDYT